MDVPAPVDERTIWKGSPSQWVNFGFFLVSGLIALALVAAMSVLSSANSRDVGTYRDAGLVVLGILLAIVAIVVLKRYLDVRFNVYEVSTDRVRLSRGILSRRMDGLELYRVDDTLLHEPFLLRLVGKGNIELVTSDRTNPSMHLKAVPRPKWLWDETRRAVEACRDRKRTRVIDFTDDDQ